MGEKPRLIALNLHAKNFAQWGKLGAAPTAGKTVKLPSCAERVYI
jgi:hypothetical protein